MRCAEIGSAGRASRRPILPLRISVSQAYPLIGSELSRREGCTPVVRIQRVFLSNQPTTDMRHLDEAHVRRAWLCSPKGRLLASFLVWKSAEAVQLMVSADLRALVQQRLAMFILRSKVK